MHVGGQDEKAKDIQDKPKVRRKEKGWAHSEILKFCQDKLRPHLETWKLPIEAMINYPP